MAFLLSKLGSYRPSSSRSFVLICGAIEYPAIRDFLCELLHPVNFFFFDVVF
jgi:hypothetical protein